MRPAGILPVLHVRCMFKKLHSKLVLPIRAGITARIGSIVERVVVARIEPLIALETERQIEMLELHPSEVEAIGNAVNAEATDQCFEFELPNRQVRQLDEVVQGHVENTSTDYATDAAVEALEEASVEYDIDVKVGELVENAARRAIENLRVEVQ